MIYVELLVFAAALSGLALAVPDRSQPGAAAAKDRGAALSAGQSDTVSDAARRRIEVSSRTSTRWPEKTMIRITVPAIPGLHSDVWCYEDQLGNGEVFPQPDGSLIMKHQHPDGAVVETKIVPHEDVVDWHVTVSGPTREAVQRVGQINPCWQFRHAAGFQSVEGREPGARSPSAGYVEMFVNQCFIYTEDGFTYLKDTSRYPDTRRADDDIRNSPVPWVQGYSMVWDEHPGQPEAGWGVSDARPIYSLIGVVSRDGKYLAAWGTRKSGRLRQGWHDCLHASPVMEEYDQKTNQIVSHSRLYFMEFDPDRLLERYKRDFAPLP